MAGLTSRKGSCRWVLRHQHKLKQIVRTCHLKVKEVFGLDDYRNYEPDSQETFKSSDLTTKLAEPDQLRLKPDVSDLKFGHIFTDHMLKIFYHQRLDGWQKPVIIPFENISLHPAAKVLHYAIELFEGMKAYRGQDGRIRIFRPDLNMNRMNSSALSSGLPTFYGEELIKCINRLVQVDQEWVPHQEGASLYIRPTLIGIDGTLGVVQSESALLYTILCPVGAYFSGQKEEGVSLLADPSYTRSWPGGCGDQKMGSNYGPTIRVQRQAALRGRQQVLWLYGPEQYLTEVGTMNIFILYTDDNGDKVLATPPLNGLILPGVTRQSIIDLAFQYKDIRVEEKLITMNDVINLRRRDRILEMFGTGTACIICPISTIDYLGDLIHIPTTEQTNPVFKKFRDELYAIQYGYKKHVWGRVIDD
ncbi:hypothetical protein HHI36_011971 [Cryptolaemus montrouzieri]|uniref:Branched-chain-amino-acid aminotransferase n=1 Tax=Cryptolaemus montrouzieri TaxID=559131 RepID=A0ABD2NDF6_9CUCU